jgi:general L-amino acid transport system permease protein
MAQAAPPKISPFYDPRWRSIAFQLLLCAVIVWLAYSAITNAAENLARARIASGFGFWNSTAGFDISQHLIPYTTQSTYGRAFWVGLLNTLLVSVLGIILATIIGFIVGVLQLSKNVLVAKLAAGYVEVIRNLPLLLQLLFWYNAVLKALPVLRDSISIPGGMFLNNRGLFLPKPLFAPGFEAVPIAFVLGIAGAVAFRVWARRRQALTGQQAPVFTVGLSLILGLPLLAFALTGFPVTFDFPEMGRFNIRGGIEILPEFAALLFGLSIYTAAFIAEVVRAAAAGRDPAGDACHHPAADQPVPEPHQELLARGRDRLSRSGADLHRHGAEPDRTGGRSRDHHHGRVPDHQSRHLRADESL